MIRVDVDGYEELLKKIPDKKTAGRALSRAFNRAISPMNSIAATETSKRYYIDKAAVRDIAIIKRARVNSVNASITWTDARIDLIKFNQTTPFTPRRDDKGHGIPVQSVIKKGSGVTEYKGAFVGTAQNSNVLQVFKRIDKDRLKIKKIVGPSVTHVLRNNGLQEKIRFKAYQILEKRIPHELNRAIEGN